MSSEVFENVVASNVIFTGVSSGAGTPVVAFVVIFAILTIALHTMEGGLSLGVSLNIPPLNTHLNSGVSCDLFVCRSICSLLANFTVFFLTGMLIDEVMTVMLSSVAKTSRVSLVYVPSEIFSGMNMVTVTSCDSLGASSNSLGVKSISMGVDWFVEVFSTSWNVKMNVCDPKLVTTNVSDAESPG